MKGKKGKDESKPSLIAKDKLIPKDKAELEVEREGFEKGIKNAFKDSLKKDEEQIIEFAVKSPTAMLPIVIRVRNKTDEKLYSIPILDYNDEFSDKVDFSSGVSTVSYKEILMSLKSKGISFSLVRIQSFGDYHKNVSKQLWQSYVFTRKEVNGNMAQKPVCVTLDPYQLQSNISEIKNQNNLGVLDGVIHNMEMNYLMPEVECIFTIYPTPTIQLKETI